MKLASLKGGRDGRLVVVSNDLAWFTEAHHIAPAEGSPAAELLSASTDSLALITMSADMLAADVRQGIRTMLSTDAAAVDGGPPLERGEAVLVPLDGGGTPLRFRVAPREVEHRRHEYPSPASRP